MAENQWIATHAKWEQALKVGDVVCVKWTNSHHYLGGVGKVVRINEKSISVELTEDVKNGGVLTWEQGQKINVPKCFCAGKFSLNNGVFPVRFFGAGRLVVGMYEPELEDQQPMPAPIEEKPIMADEQDKKPSRFAAQQSWRDFPPMGCYNSPVWKDDEQSASMDYDHEDKPWRYEISDEQPVPEATRAPADEPNWDDPAIFDKYIDKYASMSEKLATVTEERDEARAALERIEAHTSDTKSVYDLTYNQRQTDEYQEGYNFGSWEIGEMLRKLLNTAAAASAASEEASE